ncbi:hypothetical protein RF11_04773 [Thelohanellus kitauei]|uniref:Uncharacterized protein n=1 Tax=Thelohanellus kitauei TaxID=669202 RepID=A0A0C2MLK6_THEKT|nr:hypothetical protein RF11_04773 [Thelohanellus kitauei]
MTLSGWLKHDFGTVGHPVFPLSQPAASTTRFTHEASKADETQAVQYKPYSMQTFSPAPTISTVMSQTSFGAKQLDSQMPYRTVNLEIKIGKMNAARALLKKSRYRSNVNGTTVCKTTVLPRLGPDLGRDDQAQRHRVECKKLLASERYIGIVDLVGRKRL